MRIEVVRGRDLGKVVESAGTTLRIGTGEAATLRLHDDTVSREHCEIELNERGFRVRDTGSTNGVRVSGLRVYDFASAAPLQIELGDTALALTPLSEAETRERASVASFGKLLGQSSKMRELFALLARVAPTDLSVLVEGETGTGKELVAESIHGASLRAAGPFVVFDCSAVTNNLMESDLFGHERGAFTGANAARAGALEQADGGTLFLDELGELPLELQQKLLRCLQSGEFKRVGGRKLERTDVRVIAATNRNLRAEIAAGKFREDLYYRLEGVPVNVPPLRERLEDIPLLVDHFLRQSDAANGRSLPANALDMFRAHRWPGNVRELRNVVRRMQMLPELPFKIETLPPAAAGEARPALAPSGQLEGRIVQRLRNWRTPDAHTRPDWLPLEDARREFQDAFELDYLDVLKRQAGGNKTRAASLAGVTRQAIQKLVRKHDMDWGDAASEEG
ncbi:MAG TPA: sigma 54-interacting transcriptional regulator [Polyangiales bacterium]|nr:sigma 54-interacting transcriptional regulator [Polyangiales bacterium]